MFNNSTKYISLLSGDSGTYKPVAESVDKDRFVMVPGLITCAALIISYRSQKDNDKKIYIAHLGSGAILKHKLEIKAIKADACPDSIKSIYWAGAKELDDNYFKDIAEIDTILDTTTTAKADGGNVRVDLHTMLVISTNRPDETTSIDVSMHHNKNIPC